MDREPWTMDHAPVVQGLDRGRWTVAVAAALQLRGSWTVDRAYRPFIAWGHPLYPRIV